MATPTDEAVKIRILNDLLRTTGIGTVVFVGALAEESPMLQAAVHGAVRRDNTPSEGNDPYGEHDFGKVIVNGDDFMWKIDYYDLNMEFASPDPTNDVVTRRVLSIFHAEDY